ncbi:hypothetical protein [Natronolimnohabitans innermongolicus]|uniref:hypothetical protein n=1 Tax=Natronolimnohabitans innermongolicus TaxID=253107 RepID=UPI001268D0EE|nr:hypothetical protein [Natronolimnohabitans innermongolicus]
MRYRRSVLKGIGTGLAIANLSQVGAATNTSPSEEIVNRTEKLLRQGETEKALRMMDENDIDYIHDNVERPIDPESVSNGNETVVSPNRYDKSSAQFNFTVGSRASGENHYTITLYWELENAFEFTYSLGPEDIVVLAFEDNIFGPIDDGINIRVVHEWTEVGWPADPMEEEASTEIINEPITGPEFDNAVVAKIDVAEPYPGWEDGTHPTKTWGSIQCAIRRQKDATGQVKGLYEQTYGRLGSGEFNVIEDISLGSGPVSIDLPTGVSSWNEDFSEDV